MPAPVFEVLAVRHGCRNGYPRKLRGQARNLNLSSPACNTRGLDAEFKDENNPKTTTRVKLRTVANILAYFSILEVAD